MALVQTTVGLVEQSNLEIKDVIENGDSARVTATEWYLNGLLVRRDVNVNILRGVACIRWQTAKSTHQHCERN